MYYSTQLLVANKIPHRILKLCVKKGVKIIQIVKKILIKYSKILDSYFKPNSCVHNLKPITRDN